MIGDDRCDTARSDQVLFCFVFFPRFFFCPLFIYYFCIYSGYYCTITSFFYHQSTQNWKLCIFCDLPPKNSIYFLHSNWVPLNPINLNKINCFKYTQVDCSSVEDVHAALNTLKTNYKITNYILVGWSFGGAVVIAIGTHHPYLFKKKLDFQNCIQKIRIQIPHNSSTTSFNMVILWQP